MRNMLKAVGTAAFLVASGACANTPVDPVGQESTGLSLTTYTDDLIIGVYDDGVVTAELTSTQLADGVVVAEVTIGELSFKLTVDNDLGEGAYANPTVAPNGEQVAALRALESQLGFLTNDGEATTTVEQALVSLATVLSESKAGEVLPTVQFAAERGWVNIGCSNSCRTLYGSCGTNPYKQTGTGSDNCKGRCGAGCDNARSGGSHKWTMDCAEHDYQIGPLGDTLDDATGAANYNCSSGCFWASNCNSADGCSNTAGGHGPSCR